MVTITQQKHFNGIMSWDGWETKGKACRQLSMKPTWPCQRFFLIPANGLSAQSERLPRWRTLIPFSASLLLSHYTVPPASCLCSHRSAEQKLAGGGCRPIPITGKSSKQLGGGGRGGGISEDQCSVGRRWGSLLSGYWLHKGLWKSCSIPVEWQLLPLWIHTHTLQLF